MSCISGFVSTTLDSPLRAPSFVGPQPMHSKTHAETAVSFELGKSNFHGDSPVTVYGPLGPGFQPIAYPTTRFDLLSKPFQEDSTVSVIRIEQITNDSKACVGRDE